MHGYRGLFLLSAVVVANLTPLRLQAQTCQAAVQDLDFGVYSSFASAPTEADARITVRCDGAAPVPVAITIDSGRYSAGFVPRLMRHAHLEDQIGYLLFSDASMTTIWGDGTRGSVSVVKQVPPGALAEIPVYGRIPPGQDIGVGHYADRLTVHLDW